MSRISLRSVDWNMLSITERDISETGDARLRFFGGKYLYMLN